MRNDSDVALVIVGGAIAIISGIFLDGKIPWKDKKDKE